MTWAARNRRLLGLASAATLALAACGEADREPLEPRDGGWPIIRDAGPRDGGDPPRDAGPRDAGDPPRDAGPRDAGPPRDAGVPRDGGPFVRDGGPFVRDGGPFVPDGGPQPDAGFGRDASFPPDASFPRDGGFGRDASFPPRDGGTFPFPDAGPFPDGGFPPFDAGPFPDGGIPPFPDGGIPFPDAGVNNCPFVDTYSTNFFGSVFFFNFTAAGTWGAGMTAFEAENNPQIGGTYGYVDPVILINDNATGGGGCPPTDTGFYNLQFNSTCDVFAPQLLVDPCTSRAMTLSGATFTRVP